MVVRAPGIKGQSISDQLIRRGTGVSQQFGLINVNETWLIPTGNFGTTEFLPEDL